MYSFTGSSRTRPVINLGGTGGAVGSDPHQVMKRAKTERAAREAARQQEQAAIAIQAFYRSRKQSEGVKDRFRYEFDQLLAFTFPCDGNTSFGLKAEQQLNVARLLDLLYTPSRLDDTARLVQWAKLVSSSEGDATPTILSLLGGSDAVHWTTLCSSLINKMLVASLKTSDENTLLFINTTTMVLDRSGHKSTVASSVTVQVTQLVSKSSFWNGIRDIITSVSATNKSKPFLLPTIQLALLPFASLEDLHLRSAYAAFVKSIMTIPLLPNRIPITAVTYFSSNAPFTELISAISNNTKIVEGTPLETVIYLLANTLAFGSKRVSTLASQDLANYLDVLQQCIDRIPNEFFLQAERKNDVDGRDGATAVTATGKAVSNGKGEEMDTDEAPFARSEDAMLVTNAQDDDGDLIMANVASSSIPRVDQKTFRWLTTLPSAQHLTSVLVATNRSSAKTRPAFCKFLTSLLYAWSAHRERIVNILVYASGPSGERGGGLLREIWRNHVRSSALEIALRDKTRGGSPSGILNAVKNGAFKEDWGAIILLAELYSRCLLTLGDDEFFNNSGILKVIKASTDNVAQAGRNPLMLEEVVGLSAILRNIAFGLYWTEGHTVNANERVIGTRITLDELRSLSTRLLQQIYARDSRRPFCEEGFWLMTSSFDLQSFIQTVIYEESQLDQETQTAAEQAASRGLDINPVLYQGRGHHLMSQTQVAKSRMSHRQLSFISPRLGVLNNIPFVIPFDQRIAIFRAFIENDRVRLGIERHIFTRRNRHRVTVRRGQVAQDGFASLNGIGSALKETIEIVFVDEHGIEEAGIDGGGVFKEFLTSLSKEAFDNDRGLWLTNSQRELYPNPHSYSREATQLSWFAFLGRILGKALYEGILVDVAFAPAFLSKWLGKQSYLDDLATLDPQLYQGLLFLKNYRGNVETDLSLNFTITNDEFDISKQIDLIPNGKNVSVTNENRMQYIYLMSHYRLNIQMEKQCAAFFGGLSDIVDQKWLRMFNPEELKVLVGGTDQEVDVDDLEQHTVYGGWDEIHDTIRAFWRVVRSFEDSDRRKLLKFVTSCPRPPLLGFKEFNPSFAIRCAGNDTSRLPSASTCVNLLKLPAYTSEPMLRQKLLYAINSNAGFDLS